MRLKITSLLLLSFATSLAFGQDQIFLHFPEAGNRDVWVSESLPSTAPADYVHTGARQVQVDAKGHAATETVFVWDKDKGNIAARKLAEVRKEAWTVDAKDYKYVATVRVKVESEGKPVSAADVTLDDGSPHSQLLDPSMSGTVEFFGVKPGDLKITVKYRAKGAMAEPVTQLLSAPLDRKDALPTMTIALPAGASTADAVPGMASDKPTEKETPGEGEKKPVKAEEVPGTQPANPIGTFVVFLMGLGIVGALLYFALRYAKQNQDSVSEKLQQLGVQVPKPGDDPVANSSVAPVAPMPPKPEPPQKIILDDAAPTPLAAAAPAAPISLAPTGNPKLIAETGDVLELEEGETVVGREVGLGLSLIGESTVSRRHASVMKSGSNVVVKDLGSTNGTFVNGAQVQGETPLRNGDSVQFGAVRFRYEG